MSNLQTEKTKGISKIWLTNDVSVIHAQSEASEASEGIFSIKEANATEEVPQAKDAKERDIRDIIAKNKDSIYPIRHSNKWACRNCSVKADRGLLEIHACSESKKNNRASNPLRKSDDNNISDGPESIKPYEHLIEIKDLPNLGSTAYRCREHPDAPEYYDLEGIKESHFKPIHKI